MIARSGDYSQLGLELAMTRLPVLISLLADPTRISELFLAILMETTLHRQLKEHYAGPNAQLEHRVGNFRIDIASQNRLIEVQLSSLAALKKKAAVLLKNHCVEIIKPIVARKRLIKLSKARGKIQSQRWSPKRGGALDIFHELVYFTKIFPHPRLTLRVPLIEIEEHRYPSRKRWYRARGFKIQDQQLVDVAGETVYRTPKDLSRLLPERLPQTFDTKKLAEALQVERWFAQRIAYCLRETGCSVQTGKQGNGLIYELCHRPSRRAKQSRAA